MPLPGMRLPARHNALLPGYLNSRAIIAVIAVFLFNPACRLFLFTYTSAILTAITFHGFMIDAVK
jgi:hypothetical protein